MAGPLRKGLPFAHACLQSFRDGIVSLTNLVSSDIERTLITRTDLFGTISLQADLRDFAVGSSNLTSLCNLARDGVTIHSLENLHSKVYTFDDTSALVTSANATFSGMYRNLECGLGTDDKEVVRQLSRSLLSGFGADPPRRIRTAQLNALHEPLKAINASWSDTGPAAGVTEVKAAFSILDGDAFPEKFRGWLRLTMRGVMTMPENGFRLRDLAAVCGSMAAKEYPRNRHVEAKLRQQLQILRNLGIVRFVHPGSYKRTMAITRRSS